MRKTPFFSDGKNFERERLCRFWAKPLPGRNTIFLLGWVICVLCANWPRCRQKRVTRAPPLARGPQAWTGGTVWTWRRLQEPLPVFTRTSGSLAMVRRRRRGASHREHQALAVCSRCVCVCVCVWIRRYQSEWMQHGSILIESTQSI